MKITHKSTGYGHGHPMLPGFGFVAFAEASTVQTILEQRVSVLSDLAYICILFIMKARDGVPCKIANMCDVMCSPFSTASTVLTLRKRSSAVSSSISSSHVDPPCEGAWDVGAVAGAHTTTTSVAVADPQTALHALLQPTTALQAGVASLMATTTDDRNNNLHLVP
jgi:hypothetical protein